jgi:hypothetical protein
MTKKHFENQETFSLYNLTIDKMKKVREYIKSLQPNQSWELKQQNAFFNQIDKILTLNNVDEMLDAIGYNFRGKDGIYNSFDEKDKN